MPQRLRSGIQDVLNLIRNIYASRALGELIFQTVNTHLKGFGIELQDGKSSPLSLVLCFCSKSRKFRQANS